MPAIDAVDRSKSQFYCHATSIRCPLLPLKIHPDIQKVEIFAQAHASIANDIPAEDAISTNGGRLSHNMAEFLKSSTSLMNNMMLTAQSHLHHYMQSSMANQDIMFPLNLLIDDLENGSISV